MASPRVVASYRLTFGASLLAAAINTVFGFLLAWSLVRYRFPGKRIVDALVDLPFALPTAVAGIALTALYAKNGWLGQYLEPLGIKVAFTPLGVLVALIFIGLPFVVRTVQPVLEDLDTEIEEAAASLGARRWQTVRRIVLPTLFPALLTGFALAFARAVGEYGSVIFIAGNLPMVSEITPLIIITKLEQYDYAGATAVAAVMLVASFVLLLIINGLQGWTDRRTGEVALMATAATALAGPPSGAARFEGNTATRDPFWVKAVVLSASLGFFAAVPAAAADRRVRRGAAQGLERLSCGAGRARCIVRRPAHPADRGHRRAAQSGVRRGCGLGDHQVRFSRQAAAHHLHRSAVLGLAGDRGTDLRAGVRRAGLVRALAAADTTSRSSSRCRASCWPPSSSPSRSSRAS